MMIFVVWELLLQYHEKQEKPIIFLTHFRMIFTFCGGQYDRRI